MRLSIIIPAYNAEAYLECCIDSCENQRIPYQDFEIIVIDDGSCDNTLEVTCRLAQKYGNIVVESQKNQGQAAARNNGLRIANGKYVMFIDADDYLVEGKLSTLLDRIEKTDCEMLSFRAYLEREDGTVVEEPHKGMDYDRVYSGEEIAMKYSVFCSVCMRIYRLSLFRENNLFFVTGIKHEDVELCFRLYPLVESVVFTNELVYFYRFNPQSTDRSRRLDNVRKGIESDAIISSRILEYAKTSCISKQLSDRYKRIANSMMVSYFLNVRSNELWNEEPIEDHINHLRALGVYPIRGKCLNLKSYIASRLLSNACFLKRFIKR